MGRARRKYKEKTTVIADTTEQKKIKVDFDDDHLGKYDESNALVLPSKKRSTKKLNKNAAPVKLLSKRKRKLLEKIVDKKKKNENRAGLLAALEEVKASSKDLEKLTQLQAIQTLGRKRFSDDYSDFVSKADVEKTQGRILSNVKGKKRKLPQNVVEEESDTDDPNVVKLGEMSSEDESEDEVSEDEPEVIEKVDDKQLGGSNDMEDQDKKLEVKNSTKDNDASKTTEDVSEVSVVAEINGTSTNDSEMEAKPAKSCYLRQAKYVSVSRLEEIQKARLRLPVLAEEQTIMEAINENPVTVIVGSTGSGKTTQVPQFLYEAGYTSNGQMIGITEPRRVAAIAMSQRVGYEMSMTSRQVSYQIRFEGNTTPETKLKFMTDGVLLKEIQLDPTLKKYSVIVIDEAHERSIFSDILIGILSRIIPVRLAKKKPLKLIIMSATLRVEDFTENPRLFKQPAPPVAKIDARMFDVTIHYNKRTAEDYVGDAYKKACKIHRQLPEGGILIFLTGQQEVNTLVRKLQRTFPQHKNGQNDDLSNVSGFRKRKIELKEKRKSTKEETPKKIVLPEIKLEDFTSSFLDDANIDMVEENCPAENQEDANDSIELDEDFEGDEGATKLSNFENEQPLYVLPLYSLLPPDRQQQVFQPPPEGTRLCVVATNVAETSLTIPNVKYVVDSGKIKQKVYDKVTGVSMFHVTWTSQASANQRAGRAGRTAPGHCYRLYSSAVFEHDFEKFSPAEIQQRPIDDVILIMKSMNLPVLTFPFPTPPDYLQIGSGIKRLSVLGALKEKEDSNKGKNPKAKRGKGEMKDLSVITTLGKAMAAFPLAPRYGKMLALSHQHDLLPYTIAIVATLTIPEVLLETPLDSTQTTYDSHQKWQSLRISWAGLGHSRKLGDVMVLLRCVGTAEYQRGDLLWCEKNGVRPKALTEIRKLRRQLTNEINLIIPSCNVTLDPKMPPPTDDQARLLRQIVTAGLIDHVAYKVNELDLSDPSQKAKWKHAYKTQEMEEPVFLPNSSVVRIDMPQWVVYQDIYETSKMFMRNACIIEPQWLAIFAPHLCTFSAPLETPEPRYDADMDKVLCHRSSKFGLAGWVMPDVEVEYPSCQELYKWVAYFILNGEMCPPLSKYSGDVFEPRIVVNPVAIRFKKQRESLLLALMVRDVTNSAKLSHIWSTEPKYLLKEYLQWIEDIDVKEEVEQNWPPIGERNL